MIWWMRGEMWKGRMDGGAQVRAAWKSYRHLRWRRLWVEQVWRKIGNSVLDTFEIPFGCPSTDVKTGNYICESEFWERSGLEIKIWE